MFEGHWVTERTVLATVLSQKALSDCLNGCFFWPLSERAEGLHLKRVKEFPSEAVFLWRTSAALCPCSLVYSYNQKRVWRNGGLVCVVSRLCHETSSMSLWHEMGANEWEVSFCGVPASTHFCGVPGRGFQGFLIDGWESGILLGWRVGRGQA